MQLNKKKGIITVLVGVGLIILSILFSSGSDPRLGLFGNISEMKIVFKEGGYVTKAGDTRPGEFSLGYQVYENEIAIPLKYLLSISIIVVLGGIGVVLTSND